MKEGGATEEKALALALTYIPGYSNHLENVTDLGPARRGSHGDLSRQENEAQEQEEVGDKEIPRISVSYLALPCDHSYVLASPTPRFLFGAFAFIPARPLLILP